MRIPIALAGAALLLLAACGYPDPSSASGPVATTEQTTPTPVAGSDDFNEGASKTPITFPDGLKIIDLRAGQGTATATSGSTLSVQYTGWLSSGQKFDSSRDRGQPFQFTVGEGSVIPGWDEGVQGMKVGGRRKLIVPPALGYGTQGQPPVIPPNATLYFTIEVLSITPPGASPPPTASP